MFPLTRLRCLTLLTLARAQRPYEHASPLLEYGRGNRQVRVIFLRLSTLTLTFMEKTRTITDSKNYNLWRSSNILKRHFLRSSQNRFEI